MDTSHPIYVPPPDEIRQRLDLMEQERRQLLRLLRMSIAAERAAAARQAREALPGKAVPHDR